MYKAYTTPELIKRWWAGKRGEVTLAEVDLRVGGGWRYVMNAPRAASRSASTASTARSSRTSGSSRPRCFEGMPDAAALDTLTLTEDATGGRSSRSWSSTRRRSTATATSSPAWRSGMQESMDALEEVAKSLG